MPAVIVLARTIDASILTDPFFVVTGVAFGAWLLQLAYFAFITRAPDVDAGPPSMDLGSESPALVNLLVNGCRVTGAAVPATLLDLAVRDYVDIEEYGDAAEIIVRLKQRAAGTELSPYSTMVLQHLESRASGGMIRAEALTLGPEGTSKSWLARFKNHLLDEARNLGLTKPRWAGKIWSSLSSVGLIACLLFVVMATVYGYFWQGLVAAGIAASFLYGGIVQYFQQPQLNDAGVGSASRWLGVRRFLQDSDTFDNATPGAVALWDSYMAYGAAMGLANDAIRRLPMGEEDDEDAWSAYGGDWRHVRVAYPRIRSIWGKTPLNAMFNGLVILAIGAGAGWLALQVHNQARELATTAEGAKWVRLGAVIAFAIAVPVVLWGLHTFTIGLFDLFTRRRPVGEVIRRRSWTTSKGGRWYIALYDGKASKVRAWRVSPSVYHQIVQGEVIEATISPRLGHVFSFRPLPPDSKPVPSANEAATL